MLCRRLLRGLIEADSGVKLHPQTDGLDGDLLAASVRSRRISVTHVGWFMHLSK